jgi:hypothetical protein
LHLNTGAPVNLIFCSVRWCPTSWIWHLCIINIIIIIADSTHLLWIKISDIIVTTLGNICEVLSPLNYRWRFSSSGPGSFIMISQHAITVSATGIYQWIHFTRREHSVNIYIFNERFWLELIDISDLYVKIYLQFNLYTYKIFFTFTIIIALNIPPFYVNVILCLIFHIST